MKIELNKSYPVAASTNAAWKFLQDIKAVASCMPGAEITEQSDDSHFKGVVKIKVGPAVASFKGDIEVESQEEHGSTFTIQLPLERRNLHE